MKTVELQSVEGKCNFMTSTKCFVFISSMMSIVTRIDREVGNIYFEVH